MLHYIIKPLVVLISTLQKSQIFFMLAKKVFTALHIGTQKAPLKPDSFICNVTYFCFFKNIYYTQLSAIYHNGI